MTSSNGNISALLAIWRGIHRSSVNSPHKGQWRGALVFSLICPWINGWVNNREAGDLIRHQTLYEVIVMTFITCTLSESIGDRSPHKSSVMQKAVPGHIVIRVSSICVGNSPVTGEFPTQRPVTRSFDVSFDPRMDIRLSKQSWGWWFEIPSRPLWRHCNVKSIVVLLQSWLFVISNVCYLFTILENVPCCVAKKKMIIIRLMFWK